MKLAFITTRDKGPQGDLLEVSILHGLRHIMGSSCIDFPRKKVMYHDWSYTPKESLHGRGFTLYTTPLEDISEKDRNFNGLDAVLYGVSNMYGETNYPEIDNLVSNSNIFYLDGHDLYGDAPHKGVVNGELIITNQRRNCFKRQLLVEENTVWPTGFGIPKERVRDFNFSAKKNLHQNTS